MLRWSLGLALPLALSACDRTSSPVGPGTVPETPNLAAQGTIHEAFREPIGPDIILNPCTGEDMLRTGEIFVQLNRVAPPEVLEEGAEIHFEFTAVLKGSAVGTETGTTYRFHQVDHFSFNSPSVAALHATQSFPGTMHFIGPASADNFEVHFKFHVTILPSGEVKTTIDEAVEACRG